MNKISCDICMDLMPLVKDGAASEDSAQAVKQHLEQCACCRQLWEAEKLPESEEDAALSKAMKWVQKVSVLMLTLILTMGICLCELVFQGGSVLFLLVAACIGGMLRFGFRKGKRGKQWFLRIFACLTGVLLTGALLWGANEIYGNPITKRQAKREIAIYLQEKYPGQNLYVEEVSNVMKSTDYRALVRSASSKDTWFEVAYEDGRVYFDDHEARVEKRGNTADRLYREYENLALPVLKRTGLDCDIYWADTELDLSNVELILNKNYDIPQLASAGGHLRIGVGDEIVTEQRAAQLLLEIRNRMDENGIPFHSIDFSLWRPKDPENPQSWQGRRTGGVVEVEGFLYEDIYEEGLVQRICDANLDDEAYHASR